MNIIKVRIQNFRSIVDSGEVYLEPKLTILIGKNEQGKSNFLKALQSFNQNYKYLPDILSSHLRPTLEKQPQEKVPMITLWLKFKNDDKDQLASIIKGIDNVKYLKAVKYFGNNYKFTTIDADDKEAEVQFVLPDISTQIEELKSTVSELKKKLILHAERNQEFAKNKDKITQLIDGFIGSKFSETAQVSNLIKTFSTGIRGLPAQDQAVQADIATATKSSEEILGKINQTLSEDQSDRPKHLTKRLPRFIFHSTALDKIPDSVKIAEFIANPEKTSIGMLKLCTTAGLSIQKIQELTKTVNVSDVQVFEDHYKGHISGGLNEFWTQEKYEVHFRIDKEQLSLAISDGTYTNRIPLSQRSDGFQWYLSFYSTIQNESASSATTVILLDNPALELHVDGQRDIKTFLEEKVATNAQIIYVTHSPALVDPFKPEQIRIVKLLGDNQGTKITNEIVKRGEDFDLLEPLRTAIGSSVGYSLLASTYNILIEGQADKSILEGVLGKFATGKSNKISINGSLAESKDYQIAKIYKGLSLNFINVVDSDSGGREITAGLKAIGIDDKDIIGIGGLFPEKTSDFALADLFSEDLYTEAVKLTYPEKKQEIKNFPEKTGSKIERFYEQIFKEKFDIGFCKTRVAKTLKGILNGGSRIDKITEGNFKKLTKEIARRLGL
ncbi:MAG: AAA family ATPase [Candidatus Zapsychrus exili]|nr:AAA family ATPase [Candidatus Zapsychrus exili]